MRGELQKEKEEGRKELSSRASGKGTPGGKGGKKNMYPPTVLLLVWPEEIKIAASQLERGGRIHFRAPSSFDGGGWEGRSEPNKERE